MRSTALVGTLLLLAASCAVAAPPSHKKPPQVTVLLFGEGEDGASCASVGKLTNNWPAMWWIRGYWTGVNEALGRCYGSPAKRK